MGLPYKTATHTVVTVTTASGVALAANGAREYALLINISDTAIYLKLGAAAVASEGIRLNTVGTVGDRYEMSRALGNLYQGAINAIGGSTKLLLVTEGT